MEIFDTIRKRFVALTPEEWVRQHLLNYLCTEKKFPASLLAVEKQLKLNSTLKRTDVLAFTANLTPVFLAECKAPDVALTTATLNQAVRYNLVFKVPFLMITNGLEHYLFARASKGDEWIQQDVFSDYSEMLKFLG